MATTAQGWPCVGLRVLWGAPSPNDQEENPIPRLFHLWERGQDIGGPHGPLGNRTPHPLGGPHSPGGYVFFNLDLGCYASSLSVSEVGTEGDSLPKASAR